MDSPKHIFCLDDEIDSYPRNQILDALKNHIVTVATSVDQAKKKFKGAYDVLLLDHDMRGFFDSSTYHNTGYQFCVWLGTVSWSASHIVLHSQNPEGRVNMRRELTRQGVTDIDERPFSQSYVNYLRTL